MLRNLFTLLRFFLFWLAFFLITRISFEIYFRNKLKIANKKEIFETFFYALRLDCSAIAYLAVLPLAVSIFVWFVPKVRVKVIWYKAYIWLCLLVICFLTILDFNIFQEWGTKVNYRVFDSIIHQFSESIASSGSSPIGLCITIGVVLLTIGILLSNVIIDYHYQAPPASTAVKVISSALLILVTFFIMRGGTQPTPVNQSMAYFSNKQILNQSALNTEWNLFDNIYQNLGPTTNPYVYMQPKQADSLQRSLYITTSDSTVHILNTTRPNVVIFQLESFTADLIYSLGGEKNDCPNFEKFIKQGVLFDSVYAAGDRTDKGIVAILSGFPSQATRTIITNNTKQEKLPAISAVLLDKNYSTSYFYGGETEYMNFKSYMLTHGIEHITGMDNFQRSQIDSKWGVNDGTLLDTHIQYLNKQSQPFFSLIQTLTNHEPFDMPAKPHFPGDSVTNKFRSTAYYTDSCLNAYFEQAKKQPWYKNTLFILVSDYGHRLPRNTSESYAPAKYHIPLLFFGGAIKEQYRGKRIDKLGCQTDIAATLLAQLNLSHQQFRYSKDLLNPTSKPFAFFDWDNGFGFMTPQQAISFDNLGKEVIYTKYPKADKAANEKALLYGKAYLQQVFTDYMAY